MLGLSVCRDGVCRVVHGSDLGCAVGFVVFAPGSPEQLRHDLEVELFLLVWGLGYSLGFPICPFVIVVRGTSPFDPVLPSSDIVAFVSFGIVIAEGGCDSLLVIKISLLSFALSASPMSDRISGPSTTRGCEVLSSARR